MTTEQELVRVARKDDVREKTESTCHDRQQDHVEGYSSNSKGGQP